MRFKRSRRVKKWSRNTWTTLPGLGLPKKVRPRHKRCPRCKKIRLWWLPENMRHEDRVSPGNVAVSACVGCA